MQLQLLPHCICIHISQTSSYYQEIKMTLDQTFGRAFWINDVLVNVTTQHEQHQRQTFLASLYRICAELSHSHNFSFCERLLLASSKPIKLITKGMKRQPRPIHSNVIDNPYTLLQANKHESLDAIRKKYLILAKQYHPDRLSQEHLACYGEFTRKFQQIQEAYETIRAEKKKKFAA